MKNEEQEKTDLRHDTMEFAASDDETIEKKDVLDLDEDEISADELDFLEDESIDGRAMALTEVEKDRTADDDYIAKDEEWTDDLDLDDEHEGESVI